MGEPSIDSLHDVYEGQLSAARYKAERDQLRQRADALEEQVNEVDDMYRHVFGKWMDETKKARRLGKLVWRLQNRLARSHRRERALRKGMREWREKVIGAPVRTMSAYDLLPEEDLQALRWVREQGGLDVVRTHAELFQQLKGERDELKELVRGYEKHGAYDLLPEEDREALRWVRGRGGLDVVVTHTELFQQLKGERDEYRELVRRDFQDAYNRRSELCAALGIDTDTGWSDAMAEMVKRLMPEGYEWPTVDGKPVDFVTGYEPSLGVLEAVCIYSNGACDVMGHDGIIKGVKEIHVATPKVLDADGVEIREGDTVWHVETGEQCKVVEVDSGSVSVDFRVDVDGTKHTGSILPANLTHRAPVLASDGKPLRDGETVWNVKTGEMYVVGAFASGCVNVSDGRGWGLQLLPSQLTHKRPESWERLEEDAEKNPCDYFGFDWEETCGKCPASGKNCEQTMARDLVRRCRALAEREKGE